MAEDSVTPEAPDQNTPPQPQNIEETPQRVPAPEPTIVTNVDTPEEPTTAEPQPDTVPEASDTPSETDTEKGKDNNAQEAQVTPQEKSGKLKAFFHGYWAKKKWTLPVTAVVLLAVMLAVPFTGYKVLGLFIQKPLSVRVVDSVTNQPVIAAGIELNGKTVTTNSDGIAKTEAKLGKTTFTVNKQYYARTSRSVTVGWSSAHNALNVKLVATGRQVPILIRNMVTGKGLAGAQLQVGGNSVKTNKDGLATIVLSTTSKTLKGTVTADGFTAKTVSVLVTSEMTRNVFDVTPAGKLYFLSNLSGSIDVVKTNLDGTGRQTVLAGTGKEDPNSTALLASRDWKYLVLLSKRDGNQGVYLINTSNDNVTNIDGGSSTATFTLVGWSDDTFVYQVNRSNIQNWQSGAQALKSYDATSGKLYSLDQTQGDGTSQADYAYTNFGTVSIFDNELVYTKSWYNAYNHSLAGKNDSLFSTKPSGSSKQDVKDFPVPANNNYGYIIDTVAYEPYGVYVRVPNSDGTNAYYEYGNGKITQRTDVTDDVYNKPYPTFLESPSDSATFWSEVRDNKNALFIGNHDGAGAKTIATLSDYTPYGWYTDSYLLVTKNGSELFIMSADGHTPPLKISDYYKPQLTFKGYGGGYGGL